MAFPTGWYKKQTHLISGSDDGVQTNYQMRYRVLYTIGTSYEDTICVNEHCKSDFTDLRFTDGNTVPLDYWIEETSLSTEAYVWVEMSSIPADPESGTLIVWYDNSEATDESDGDDTFIIFDHFEGTSLDSSKWSTVGTGHTISVTDSVVTVTHTPFTSDGVNRGFLSSSSFPNTFATHLVRSRVNAWMDNVPMYCLSQTSRFDMNGILMDKVAGRAVLGVDERDLGGGYEFQNMNAMTVGTWYNFIYTKDSTINLSGYQNRTYVTQCTTNLKINDKKVGLTHSAFGYGSPVSYSADYIALGKFTPSIPGDSTWSEEEDLTPAPSVTVTAKRSRKLKKQKRKTKLDIPLEVNTAFPVASQLELSGNKLMKYDGNAVIELSQQFPLTIEWIIKAYDGKETILQDKLLQAIAAYSLLNMIDEDGEDE